MSRGFLLLAIRCWFSLRGPSIRRNFISDINMRSADAIDHRPNFFAEGALQPLKRKPIVGEHRNAIGSASPRVWNESLLVPKTKAQIELALSSR